MTGTLTIEVGGGAGEALAVMAPDMIASCRMTLSLVLDLGAGNTRQLVVRSVDGAGRALVVDGLLRLEIQAEAVR